MEERGTGQQRGEGQQAGLDTSIFDFLISIEVDESDAQTYTQKLVANGYKTLKKLKAAPPSHDDLAKLEFSLADRNLILKKLSEKDPITGASISIFLPGYEEASKVFVKGSWNWDIEIELNKKYGGWFCILNLGVGQYEYLFHVDGSWVKNLNEPVSVQNPQNNSIIVGPITERKVTLDSTMFGDVVKVRVRNYHHPEKFFEGEFLLDTGCRSCLARIPLKKVKELGLVENFRKTTHFGDTQGFIGIFGPVKMEIRTDKGNLISCVISVGAHLDAESLANPPPQRSRQTAYLIEDQTDVPDDETVPLSPVSYPPDFKRGHDTCLMGPGCLQALHLGYDTKNNRLYHLF